MENRYSTYTHRYDKTKEKRDEKVKQIATATNTRKKKCTTKYRKQKEEKMDRTKSKRRFVLTFQKLNAREKKVNEKM